MACRLVIGGLEERGVVCEYVHYYLCKLLLVLWSHKKSCVQIML